MDTIEVEKQDRKRQRNRIAATKCRKRKIERITQLEHEVRELNDQLQKRIKAKRELEIEVDEIRNRLKIHIKQGCSGLEEYLQDWETTTHTDTNNTTHSNTYDTNTTNKKFHFARP